MFHQLRLEGKASGMWNLAGWMGHLPLKQTPVHQQDVPIWPFCSRDSVRRSEEHAFADRRNMVRLEQSCFKELQRQLGAAAQGRPLFFWELSQFPVACLGHGPRLRWAN